jgi:nucleoside-diphosphate-sugar epimerase
MAVPGLGLSGAAARLLRLEADVVVNCAAVTSFLKPAACETVNVAGLKNLLDIAAEFEKPVLFVSFGSAAACGRRSDSCLSEEEYPRPGVGHLVHYTRTKASAEELLRRQSRIPDWLILRPSIVLPDNVAEERLARGIAWALVVMKEVRCLPLRSTARVDAVPLSFVGECALRLIAKVPRAHNCYHISAGPDRSAVWGEVLALLREIYGSHTVCCDPSRWPVERRALTAREIRLFRRVSPYVPFINQNLVFANDRLYQDLSEQPPELPHFRSYLPHILKRIALDEALLEGRDP